MACAVAARQCDDGRLLHGYLKVHDHCLSCGEEMHHHRADDFPQYLTIFVVGHVLAAALLLTDDLWPDLPMAFHYVVWPSLVVVLCLWLLPVFKGGLVAYQWALRMHGFETAHATFGQEVEKPEIVGSTYGGMKCRIGH